MKRPPFFKTVRPASVGAAMADMALLLLVFFMAATSTEPPKGVEVDLPQAVTEGAEQDSIYVTVGKDANIYLDGENMGLETLARRLRARQREKDKLVAVTADRNLDYSQVSRVLEVLRENQFLNLLFMAEGREE